MKTKIHKKMRKPSGTYTAITALVHLVEMYHERPPMWSGWPWLIKQRLIKKRRVPCGIYTAHIDVHLAATYAGRPPM